MKKSPWDELEDQALQHDEEPKVKKQKRKQKEMNVTNRVQKHNGTGT